MVPRVRIPPSPPTESARTPAGVCIFGGGLLYTESMNGKRVQILYTNYKGVTAERIIEPIEIWFGHTEYHPVDQWLLKARDMYKEELRDFALQDIKKWEVI